MSRDVTRNAVPHGLDNSDLGGVLEERRALDDLFSATYEELRRLASAVRRDDPSATLSPTTLVNEAWLKLRESPQLASVPRLHFKRIAARAMRQVLVEAARRRKADKRGGGVAIVTFDDALAVAASGTAAADDLLALDDALDELARIDPRQATDGGEPVLRRPRHRGDGRAARRVRSHGAARLAGGPRMAGARAASRPVTHA